MFAQVVDHEDDDIGYNVRRVGEVTACVIQDFFDWDDHGIGVVQVFRDVRAGAVSREAEKQFGDTRVELSRTFTSGSVNNGAGG